MKKELLEKLKNFKSKEEIKEFIKNNNLNIDETKIDTYLNKNKELDNDELNSVSAGCFESDSGENPKFKIGDKVDYSALINHSNNRFYGKWTITSVSSSKSIDSYGCNVFTYSIKCDVVNALDTYLFTDTRENISENDLD